MTKRPSPPPGPPPSNREKMKDAVQELMSQVAEKKAQTRADVVEEKQRQTRRQRTRYFQAAALLVLLIVSLVFMLPRWRQPFQPPSGAEAERDARKAIIFASTLVDRYEARSGRLPGSFNQVGVTIPGLVYTVVGSSYILSMQVDGHEIVFHKGDDAARFLSSSGDSR